MHNILITGGYGCIGSETAKWLLRNTPHNVTICSRKVSDQRTGRIFHDVDRTRLKALACDVCDPTQIAQILAGEGITRVGHLAALQTPDCNAYRDLGLQTNLAATQHLIESIKTGGRSIERVVFASSIAVYGPRAAYPAGLVPMLSAPQPVNVYGVWKLASEMILKFFQQDTGISTVCLRPGVLFGPGRDAGLTSSPTTAMKCVALDLPYEVPFKTQQDYLYAPDAGAAFAQALVGPFDGYGVFTMPHHTANTAQIVSHLQQAATQLGIPAQFKITVGQPDAPFISELDYEPFLQAFPDVQQTELAQAIRNSLTVFMDQVQRGWLQAADIKR
ncbi:MAG: NAD(P)-dependent oxidoreductase [Pirellulaceae bacterium]|nr:NAD(P)-dependent oxidoreductase [Pirellulaceae bacterium]